MLKIRVLIIILFSAFNLNAQTKNVELRINHKLGNEVFELNKSSENNINQKFYCTRLQYYVSEISIVHDNGTETLIDDLWLLINATDGTTNVDLGTHEIGEIEGISFHIGVDQAHNHLDPTLWPQDHPLAPQAPSMHWGWSPGYRFVAIEGFGGDQLDQLFQLHGLGDNNYFKTTISIIPQISNDKETIVLNADYSESLNDIRLNEGKIVHSDDAEAKKVIENFQQFIFSNGNSTTSVSFTDLNENIKIFPNPILNNEVFIKSDNYNELKYSIGSLSGHQIDQGITTNKKIDLSNLSKGIYLLSFYNNNTLVAIQKLIVN